jgi:hypothetical protein
LTGECVIHRTDDSIGIPAKLECQLNYVILLKKAALLQQGGRAAFFIPEAG